MFRSYIIQLLLSIILISTVIFKFFKLGHQNKPSFVYNKTTYVNPALQPYLYSFVYEAQKRNIIINADNVSMYITDSITTSTPFLTNVGYYAGLAVPDKRAILVDTTTLIWKLNPETLVFHELGHLLLNRRHDNAWFTRIGLDGDSIPKSLMHESRSYFYGEKHVILREYYIDELFDSAISINTWCPNEYIHY